MLHGRVEMTVFNYGAIQSQPGMHLLPKDDHSRRASPSSLLWKPHGPNKREGAPPADSECPLLGTKGFLRGNLTSCSNLSLQLPNVTGTA